PTQVNINPADPGQQPPSILPALDSNATRELFYFRGDVGSSMARVYPFEHFGLTRLKHTIEPSLGYLFVPQSDTRQAALPVFDDVDRINQRSAFTYGVTSRLLGRLASAPAPSPGKKHQAKPTPQPSPGSSDGGAPPVSLDGTRAGKDVDGDGGVIAGGVE